MNIRLKNLYILEDNITKEDAIFACLIDNSYAEWNDKWKFQEMEKEEIGWKATFEIDYKGKKGEFSVDTQGEYLTHLDLDGYIGGESIELDEDIQLKIASRSSGILIALYYSEACRLGILRESLEKALYYTIFPEWTRGLVGEGVEEIKGVKEFVKRFKEVYEKFNIFKEINIEVDFNKVEISGGNEVLQKAIVSFLGEYLNKEVFFFLHNIDYVGSVRELQEVEATLSIDTSIIDEYE